MFCQYSEIVDVIAKNFLSGQRETCFLFTPIKYSKRLSHFGDTLRLFFFAQELSMKSLSLNHDTRDNLP